ncbi:MAG: hypothetical protein BGN99_09270 [Alphaproteobacteria bacterium 65-37]|jgi:hypothetical protein|nr:MAG: hypothetical protein BGN99_09270 [Alphaproteobacteria bacterium 65-37]
MLYPNGKAFSNAVDLLPKTMRESFAGEPDLDEWPLADRQISLQIERRQVVAKFGQAHIAYLWEPKEGNRSDDGDVLGHNLRPADTHKRDPMLIRLLRGGQRDE